MLPGQEVSGELHFTLMEARSYKSIEMKIYGGAHVKWCETHTTGYGEYQTTQIVTYESREMYVEDYRVLWSSKQSPDGKIGPGMFSLPFQFTLPATCLGTFKGKWGSITYSLQAKIITGQLLHFDHKVELPFKVKRVTDINLPHLTVPTQQSEETQVGCLCCNSGELQFTAKLSRSGCCIGQSLPLSVSVANSSSRHIKMRTSLIRHCTYHATGHMQEASEALVVLLSPEIESHSEYTWNVDKLTVPEVEPSFEGSQIIKVEHTLKVTAVIPWDLNTSVEFPITLGNVPFKTQ